MGAAMTNGANPISGKIEVHAEGIGTITYDMVSERARELALMDGRREFNEADLDRAYAELLGNPDETPAETGPELEEVTEWDESPGSNGKRVAGVRPEDEMTPAELLVHDGIEEAEHEHRLAAAVEHPPEED